MIGYLNHLNHLNLCNLGSDNEMNLASPIHWIRPIVWAYVQFRGSKFHTKNARSRQLQEQRRAKAQR